MVLPPRATLADAEAFLLAQDAWVSACHTADPEGLDKPRRAPALPDSVALLATGGALDVTDQRDLASLHERLRQHAITVLPDWVRRHSAETGLTVKRVAVRNQRSRWGSYSSRGTLSLNWRLLLMTPDMVDYVILHELAHSQHLNHSAAFWQVLDGICPGARARDRAFDQRAAELLPAWAKARPS